MSSKNVIPVYILTALFERTCSLSHQHLLLFFTCANLIDKTNGISMYLWPWLLMRHYSLYLLAIPISSSLRYSLPIFFVSLFNTNTFDTSPLNTMLIIDLLKFRKFVVLFIANFQEYYFVVVLFKQRSVLNFNKCFSQIC